MSIRVNVVWTGILAVLLAGAPSVVASAPRTSVDSAIRAAERGNAPVTALLALEPGAELSVSDALAALNVPIDAVLPGHLLRVVLHPKAIAAVSTLPGVRGISADAVVAASGAAKKTSSSLTTSKTTTDTTSTLWSFADWTVSFQQWDTLFGALGLKWSPYRGAGVGIAIVDSGIDGTLPDFSGRITDFYDFTAGGRKVMPTDDYGHGTHIAGLIGAAGTGFSGIAPDVHFVGLKVLDATGQGTTSNVIAALDFLVKNRQRLGVQIVNLSMGHPILEPAATDPLVQAVERAVASGLIVVTSAGNYGQNPTTGLTGYAGITSPGNAPSALTAGSLDLHDTADRRDDTVSPFSSRGPTWYDGLVKPDLLAPGHGLYAASAAGSTLALSGTLTASGADLKLFGTSMAAATTTGVVALMIEANRRAFPAAGRDLTPNAIKAILQFTAIAVPDPATGHDADLLTEGAGGINGRGATALASAVDPSAAVGAWWLMGAASESSLLGGLETPWTRRIIWGTTPLYGDAVYANAPAWQTNVVWGSGLVWGDALVWGEALVWGNTLVWGENIVTSTALVWGESIVWGDGLVTVDGQSFVWGDALIWGESLIWGDALVWGASALQ